MWRVSIWSRLMVIKVILQWLDNRIVVLQSQYIDLNRDRGSSSSILYILLYILCDVRRCARLLHNINIEEKKRRDEKENYWRAAISVQINVLRLKHYYSVVNSWQDDFDDHESRSNRYSFYIIFILKFHSRF